MLPDLTVILLSLLFYFQGMRCAGQAFTSAYGLYWVTKWKAVLEAVSLPVLMLILVRPLGMNGVLLSGIISTLCISTVYEGWAVYRRGFDAPLRNYVKMFALYSVLDVGAILLGFWICSFIALPGLIAFLVDAVIGMALPVAVLWLCFHRTREYAETRSIIKRVAARLRVHGRAHARGTPGGRLGLRLGLRGRLRLRLRGMAGGAGLLATLPVATRCLRPCVPSRHGGLRLCHLALELHDTLAPLGQTGAQDLGGKDGRVLGAADGHGGHGHAGGHLHHGEQGVHTAAMITRMSRASADEAHSATLAGLRWAEWTTSS